MLNCVKNALQKKELCNMHTFRKGTAYTRSQERCVPSVHRGPYACLTQQYFQMDIGYNKEKWISSIMMSTYPKEKLNRPVLGPVIKRTASHIVPTYSMIIMIYMLSYIFNSVILVPCHWPSTHQQQMREVFYYVCTFVSGIQLCSQYEWQHETLVLTWQQGALIKSWWCRSRVTV